MKKIISISIPITVILFSGWYFWPEVLLATTSFPNDMEVVMEKFGVDVYGASTGGDETAVFSGFSLGLHRILWLEHKPHPNTDETILSADILYYFNETEMERTSRQFESECRAK